MSLVWSIFRQVLDVAPCAGEEIIDTQHVMAAGEQLLAEMRTYEAGPAGDQHALSLQFILRPLFHRDVFLGNAVLALRTTALTKRGLRETAPFDLPDTLAARAFDRCGRVDMSNP